MKNKYYVYLDYLTHGDKDSSSLFSVPKELFDKLEPFREELSDGRNVPDAQDYVDKVFGCEKVFFSEKQIEKIDDSRYIYVALV